MPVHKRLGEQHRLALLLALLVATFTSTGCLSTSPKVVKVGFVAPFEGRYREIGDQVIAAARLAVREYASQSPDDHLVIELVAYDDRGIPDLAVEQANKLVADPEVAVVVGHWRDKTTRAALPVYEKAGIPLVTFSPSDLPASANSENLSPSLDEMRQLASAWNSDQGSPATLMLNEGDDALDTAAALTFAGTHPAGNAAVGGPVWGLNQFHALAADTGMTLYFVTGAAYPDDLSEPGWPTSRVSNFMRGYEKGSLGAPPGLLSVISYNATWQAIYRVTVGAGLPLAISASNPITFDAAGRRQAAPVYLYLWDDDRPRLVKRLR